MRINRKVVIDIETAAVIERQASDYDGSVALAFGGGGSSGGGSSAPPVYTKRIPEEQGAFDLFTGIIDQMLQDQGYDLNKFDKIANYDPELKAQIGQYQTQQSDLNQQLTDINAEIAKVSKLGTKDPAVKQQLAELNAAKTALSGQVKTVGDQIKAANDEYNKGLAALKGQISKGEQSRYDVSLLKRPLTPEQQKERDFESQLTDYYQGALTEGMAGGIPSQLKGYIDEIYADQDRQAKEQLMKMGVEMAGSRGLNLSDTPIAQPLLQQYANVQSQLGAARAGSYLGERSNELARAQAFREFQTNLNQMRNFSNPNALLTHVGNIALGTYQPRFRGGVGGQQQTGGSTASGVSSILGGLGSLAGGIGAMGGLLGGGAGAAAAISPLAAAGPIAGLGGLLGL